MTPPLSLDVLRAGYGKLPSSREYVRLDSDRGAARWFRDYLDRAAVHFATRPAAASPGHRIVTSVPDGGPLVVASVWPSADEGGRRSFPFSFYTLLPESRRPPRHPGFFAALAGLHADHDGLFAEALRLQDALGFDRAFGSRERPVPVPLEASDAARRHADAAAAVPLAPWFESVFGGASADACEAGAMVLWRVRNVLGAADGSLARLGQQCPGVRLPFAPDVDAVVQADAWLALLAGPGGRLTCDAHFLLGPMPFGEAPGLGVFFRPLSPHDAGLFDGRGIAGIVDLSQTREPADLDGFGAFVAAVRRAVLSPGATLEAFPSLLTETLPA